MLIESPKKGSCFEVLLQIEVLHFCKPENCGTEQEQFLCHPRTEQHSDTGVSSCHRHSSSFPCIARVNRVLAVMATAAFDI